MYIPRAAEPVLRSLARGYPVIAVTGPRQSGKTTLVRAAFSGKPYVSLEDLDQRAFADEDPRGFLSLYPQGVILDEVQHCPGLFSYLQTLIDRDPRPARFILTGSQQFGLLSRVTQSLAGRVALQPLLPFAFAELQSAGRAPRDLKALLLGGLYPPVHDRELDPGPWYANYVLTYLERDVRQMINVRNLSLFQRFLRMCAAHTAQLLNLSSLAADCGITHNTAKAWISILEASYLVHQLQPHHRNFRKRLLKTPKLYFLDTGLCAALLGIQTGEQLLQHPLRGALFETWVVGELLKGRLNVGKPPNLYFWRDRTGHEVDVLIEDGATLRPVEIKSGQTAAADALDGLKYWTGLAGKTAGKAALVYGGATRHRAHGVDILPWTQIGELTRTL
jgi:hypothetical protein